MKTIEKTTVSHLSAKRVPPLCAPLESSLFERTALSCFLLLTGVIAFAMLGFLIGSHIRILTFLIPCAIIAAYGLLRDRKLFFCFLGTLVLLALWSALCSQIYDWSYDGMSYHKQAAITLKEGWNPLRSSSADKDIFATYPTMALWLDNYPKGLWTFSAVLYRITNLIETTKAVNILFLAALFGVAADVLGTVFKMNGTRRLMLALLFVLNPVFLCQLFTSYVDLAVGSMIIMAVLLCFKIYHECANKYTYALLFCLAAVSCTVKFTAPVLVGLVLLTFGAAYAVKTRWNWKKLARPVAVTLLAFTVGVVALGYDPYIKHVTQGVHIIHPVMGKDKYDIMNTNPPEGFDSKNGIQKLGISLFSQTDNTLHASPRLKFPFMIYQEELEHLSNADIRLGGFGVWFSGALLVSLLLLAAALLKKTKCDPCIYIALGFFTLLALFFPESWWARYASYTYYIPVLILLYGMNAPKTKALCGASYGLLAANSLIALAVVLSAGIQTTKMLDKKLADIKAQHQKVLLRVNDFPSHVKWFSEHGIDFVVTHTAIDQPTIFYRNTKYKFIED